MRIQKLNSDTKKNLAGRSAEKKSEQLWTV